MLTDGIKKLFVFKAIKFLFNYKRGVKKDFDVNVQSLKFIIPNNECIVRECTAESHSINKYTYKIGQLTFSLVNVISYTTRERFSRTVMVTYISFI